MKRNQHQENRRVDAPRAAPSAPPAVRARAPAATSATPRTTPPAARARAPAAARTATRAVPRAAPSAPAPTRPSSSFAAADRPSSSSATAARSRAKKTFIPPRLSGTGRVRKPSYKMSEWFNCSQGSKK
ncbi:hypothetical protein ACQJBY_018715 [Aegilops geniculata]